MAENNFVYPRDVQRFGFDWGRLALTVGPEVNGAEMFSGGVVDLPSGQGHSRHNHPGCEEIIFVISGGGERMGGGGGGRGGNTRGGWGEVFLVTPGEGEQMVETPEGVPVVQKVSAGCT